MTSVTMPKKGRAMMYTSGWPKHQDAGEQHVPGEDRHAEHGHAGAAHADDRGDEVDRAKDGTEAGQHQPHDPQVAPDADRVLSARQRGVGESAEVGRTL